DGGAGGNCEQGHEITPQQDEPMAPPTFESKFHSCVPELSDVHCCLCSIDTDDGATSFRRVIFDLPASDSDLRNAKTRPVARGLNAKLAIVAGAGSCARLATSRASDICQEPVARLPGGRHTARRRAEVSRAGRPALVVRGIAQEKFSSDDLE